MGKVSTFEEKNIWKVLFKVAPPVMLAQLILAMYNIVDSYFVGKYSGRGLTALSVIFPIQLIIIQICQAVMPRTERKGRTKRQASEACLHLSAGLCLP